MGEVIWGCTSYADVAACHPCKVVDYDLHFSKVDDFEVPPLVPEVFENEPSMATVGSGLAAEKCGRGYKQVSINSVFNLPFLHKL